MWFWKKKKTNDEILIERLCHAVKHMPFTVDDRVLYEVIFNIDGSELRFSFTSVASITYCICCVYFDEVLMTGHFLPKDYEKLVDIVRNRILQMEIDNFKPQQKEIFETMDKKLKNEHIPVSK